jgi:hypothetical protein
MFAYSYEQWHSPRFREIQAREWRIANRSTAGIRRAIDPRDGDGAGAGVGLETAQALDERILANGPMRLYHEPERLAEEAAVLRTLRYRMHVVDASRFTTTGAFHAKVRLLLEDRGLYQESLDGFADALLALPFSQFGRAAIVFQHFDVFARQCGKLATQVLDCVGLHASTELARGRRLLVLLQSDSPTFDLAMLESACAASESAVPASAAPRSGVHARVFDPSAVFDVEDTLVEMRVAL